MRRTILSFAAGLATPLRQNSATATGVVTAAGVLLRRAATPEPTLPGHGRRLPWELVVPVAVVAVAGWRRRWITEDAFINFRVVSVTRQGRQPLAFNRGERVEAATSPLWIATLVVLDATLGRRIPLERLAMGAGLGLSVLGVAAATAASARLADLSGFGQPWPAGALVLSVLPPLWDFATSGLETGLTFGWLGSCQWLLAERLADLAAMGSPLTPSTAGFSPVLLGLGPLIRPDLALFSALYVAAHVTLSQTGWRSTATTFGAAAALPTAYQLFRMAYFANTVPNTALAKEASRSDWRRGLAYLDNHASTYALAVPTALVGAWTRQWLRRSSLADNWRLAVVVATPVAAALLHGAYIVRLGGDFMHSRLLLPATFGLFMAAAALPAAAATPTIPAALLIWAISCGIWMRLPDGPRAHWSGIVDERAWWRREAGHPNPITIDDYHRVTAARSGWRARGLAAQGADMLVRIDGREHRLAPGSGVVLESITIGLGSTAAGPDVHVIDVLGLADAVGSRIPVDPEARIGHQKRIPQALVLARLVLANDDDLDLSDTERGTVEAARRLLRQPAVARLLAATQDPITVSRALRNIRQALSFTRLRLPITSVSGISTPRTPQDRRVPLPMLQTEAE